MKTTNLEKLNGMWLDMARRLLRFHKGEDWHKIGCWGLATVSSVKKLLNRGSQLFNKIFIFVDIY